MSDIIAKAVQRLCAEEITDIHVISEALIDATNSTPNADKLADLIGMLGAMIFFNNDVTTVRRQAAARRMEENRRLAADGRAKQGRDPL